MVRSAAGAEHGGVRPRNYKNFQVQDGSLHESAQPVHSDQHSQKGAQESAGGARENRRITRIWGHAMSVMPTRECPRCHLTRFGHATRVQTRAFHLPKPAHPAVAPRTWRGVRTMPTPPENKVNAALDYRARLPVVPLDDGDSECHSVWKKSGREFTVTEAPGYAGSQLTPSRT